MRVDREWYCHWAGHHEHIYHRVPKWLDITRELLGDRLSRWIADDVNMH
jgi:hypothetical protein